MDVSIASTNCVTKPKDAFVKIMKGSYHESTHNPIVWGVVYCIRLNFVPDDDLLKGTPYFGQAVRPKAQSAADAAAMRWNDHIKKVRKMNKQVGFIAALGHYGKAAFSWTIVESKHGPRNHVQAWADKLEVDLINQHGGVLQTMTPNSKLLQCFNISAGGKSDFKWQSLEAFHVNNWLRFQKELEKFVSDKGTAWVPDKFVTNDGYKLGMKSRCIRHSGSYMAGYPERKVWLESLPGWLWRFKDSTKLARSNPLPYEPCIEKRVRGEFYLRLDGRLGRCDGKSLKLVDKKEDVTASTVQDQQRKQYLKRKREAFADKQLEEARNTADPWEPDKRKRVIGRFYIRPDGYVSRWNGQTAVPLGPYVDGCVNTSVPDIDHKAAKRKHLSEKKAWMGRERLEHAQKNLQPFLPPCRERIKGAFYLRRDGRIARWTGNELRPIGGYATARPKPVSENSSNASSSTTTNNNSESE